MAPGPDLLPYRFRWVFCQLEVLRHCLPASIRQTLDQLPESLDETYVRMLSQIPQANQAHAHRMLQCLLVSIRPLRVEELAELLVFEFDATQGGIPKYRAAWQLDDQTQAVLSTCSSLVTIINERQSGDLIVQFSHFSVKEFLISNRLGGLSRYQIHPLSAHTIITQACLGVLCHLRDHTAEENVKRFPLAGYAARHWVYHARFEDVASRLKDGVETLFDSDKPHLAAWLAIDSMDGFYSRLCDQFSDLKPIALYYSVVCGFHFLVKHLAIKHRQYVNAIYVPDRFLLHTALNADRVDIAELLLEHGADVNLRDQVGETMLLRLLSEPEHYLSKKVTFLLKHGADANVQGRNLMSPLHLAEMFGEREVAQILLKYNANTNSQAYYGKTPLHILSELWHDAYNGPYCKYILNHARLLLEHGADANIRDDGGRTPLHLAVSKDQFGLAEILLEHGAESNAENNNGKTTLHMLSESRVNDNGNVLHLARLLLKHEADVNRRDKDHQTPLHLAVGRDRFKLAGVLLEHGADANAEDKNGKTPVNINSEVNFGRTLLHAVAKGKYGYGQDVIRIVQLLLERGADAHAKDKDDATPLHIASYARRFEIARVLLDGGAVSDSVGNQGRTPLHLVAGCGYLHSKEDGIRIAQLLLERGADVNALDETTSLHCIWHPTMGRSKLLKCSLMPAQPLT
jgi:ankyrin repeat protein